ncbi:hypothetical protein [Chitinophaga sp.]|uniref:DUF6712 family protein n=1 Tax=Chitinophaga sp. TaxID=1869181 RepID=UPI0031DB9D1C
MSKNILFISEQKLKDSSMLSENVDPKHLLPIVKVVQDRFILPMLGTNLYNKLQDLVAANAVDGNYKILLDDYLTDTQVWYTLAELPISIQYKLINKGVVIRTGEAIQTVSFSDVQSLMDNFRTNAKFYAQRTIDYLCEKQSLFPEYVNPGNGSDTIHPDQTQYECGIFLGGYCHEDRRSFEERYQGNSYRKPL